ncbi:hypothetical protein HS125_12905 [bacterium]|nr:hypothetical protein [bacterium]
MARNLQFLYRASQNKLGVDEFYDRVFVKRLLTAAWLASVFDAMGIDGVVHGLAALVQATGRKLRALQSGQAQSYVLGMFIGAVIILAVVWLSA